MWRSTRERAIEREAALDDVWANRRTREFAIRDSRRLLRNTIRDEFKSLVGPLDGSVEIALRQAGVPPSRQWRDLREESFSPAQLKIWKLVGTLSAKYGSESSFDEARAALSYYWEGTPLHVDDEWLYRLHGDTTDEAILLAWLELAVAKRIGHYSDVGTRLFEVALRLNARRSQQPAIGAREQSSV